MACGVVRDENTKLFALKTGMIRSRGVEAEDGTNRFPVAAAGQLNVSGLITMI